MKLFELRRVPPNWEHPKGYREYAPLQYITFEEAAKDWKKKLAKWKPEENICIFTSSSIEFWEAYPPPQREGRRSYTNQEATWFQAYLYQRAIPASPPFKTKDELITYLTTKGDFDAQRRHEEYGEPLKLWTLDEAKKLCRL